MTRPSEPVELPLRISEDLARMRKMLGGWMAEVGASAVSRSRVLTAATELGRNVIRHGQGGWVSMDWVEQLGRVGIRLVFEDEGPGISDLDLAWRDGYSTAGGLGLGLGGSRRLLRDVSLEARQPSGLRVTAIGWIERPRARR